MQSFVVIKKSDNGTLQIMGGETYPEESSAAKEAEKLTINNGANYIVAQCLYEFRKKTITDKYYFHEDIDRDREPETSGNEKA